MKDIEHGRDWRGSVVTMNGCRSNAALIVQTVVAFHQRVMALVSRDLLCDGRRMVQTARTKTAVVLFVADQTSSVWDNTYDSTRLCVQTSAHTGQIGRMYFRRNSNQEYRPRQQDVIRARTQQLFLTSGGRR